jgi:energy-coupling factor transporter ATP-binding protein EcfA2
MIKVDSITIKEFRGIRDLTLDFKGNNFAICGPNGTGKSGVVDALEFILTGSVSRLSGEGRGEISLKHHGPHVDKRDDPEKARVIAKITIPSLKTSVTIERNVKSPTNLIVDPKTPEILEVLQKVKAHPEIVLSRRELIRYVLATPGKRAEEVQALLHLDQIEAARATLQKIANTSERQLTPIGTAVTVAVSNLSRALSISEFTTGAILGAANAQRKTLELPELTELSATNSLKDGMAIPTAAKPQLIPKKQALADIQAVHEALNEIKNSSTKTLSTELIADLEALAADPSISAGVTKENFYTTGLSLIADESCPFCDKEWDVPALRAHAQAKINHLKELTRKRKGVEKKMLPLIGILRRTQAAANVIVRYSALAKPPILMKAVADYSSTCETSIQALTSLLPFKDSIAAMKSLTDIPKSVLAAIINFEKAVASLPDSNKQDAAREYLTIGQERLEDWRIAKRKQKIALSQAKRARQVSDIYATTSDTVLTGLYTEVQKHFIELYTFIHRSDEKGFAAKLVPSMGKLGFDVDFYNRGFFPPGAYHSEGHQDSMGLCLYLALMHHLQDANFTFAVLDDVLMSVDTGHRREVCALLKKSFPHTQFVVTTHDPIWLRHMKTERLIVGRGAVQFRAWDVDHGPTQWDDRDVWAEINDYLKANDVRAAAGLLRHYLEYTATELCHRLRAPVEFRADAQYQLGELMPAAIHHLHDIYSRAKEAANSWNQKDIIVALTTRDTEFGKLAQTAQFEQWQVNGAIHFNTWDNLTKKDFVPVTKAFQELLAGFACLECKEYLRVAPDRETAETIRCECGKINYNLLRK